MVVVRGQDAMVPVVVGTCDDEGTLFALPSLSITTTSDVLTYLSAYFFHNLPPSDLKDDLLDTHYPEDPAQGSPFGTGARSAVTPQFKRLAAVVGDWVFEAPKRVFLEAVGGRQDAWTYLSKRKKDLDVLGAAHVSDLYYSILTPTDMLDHLIYFVNYLNPNGSPAYPAFSSKHVDLNNNTHQLAVQLGNAVTWPKYNPTTKRMLVYVDGNPGTQVAHGSERSAQVGYLQGLLGPVWVP